MSCTVSFSMPGGFPLQTVDNLILPFYAQDIPRRTSSVIHTKIQVAPGKKQSQNSKAPRRPSTSNPLAISAASPTLSKVSDASTPVEDSGEAMFCDVLTASPAPIRLELEPEEDRPINPVVSMTAAVPVHAYSSTIAINDLEDYAAGIAERLQEALQRLRSQEDASAN